MATNKKTNTISAVYKTIDQKQLSDQAKETLKKLRLATGNFRSKDERANEAFNAFYKKLLEKKPTAVKTTKEYKDMVRQRQVEHMRKVREARKEKEESKKGQGNDRDAARPAKPYGWRLRGKHNYRKPTLKQISNGEAYYEGRVNRADVKRRKFPMLEKGGYMAKGGEIKVINLSDDDKLNYFINKEVNNDKNYTFVSDMLTTTYNGKKFYSLGYDTPSKGSAFSLEEAKKNARIIKDSDLGKKWDVIIKEIGGNFGDEDFTKESYVVMTSPLFPKEMLREMRGILKYAEGGDVDKGGMIYALREYISSGEIANKTDVLNYDDIAKIRRIAIQYYMDNGDQPYSFGELNRIMAYANEKFKSGQYAKGGNVYSSDDAYEAIILKDGVEVDRVVLRAKNKGEARMMYEDYHEGKMMKNHGEDITYEIIVAPSKMAKGGKIKYSAYDNKSLEYIEGEIAHTERSARQFQQMGDYESMEDRKAHAKELREIYFRKQAETKMAMGGEVFYKESHKMGH